MPRSSADSGMIVEAQSYHQLCLSLRFHFYQIRPDPMIRKPVEWIFFDCFNTLIDDVDATGDESGIKPVSHIPVQYNFFEAPTDFHQAYLTWRTEYWARGNHDEVFLPDRLAMVLKASKIKRSLTRELTKVIEEMMTCFHEVYPTTIRKSPGIEGVLKSLHGKIKMGVVSNFFLPGYPKRMLQQQGLDHYFDFILDSAEIKIKKPGKQIYLTALEKASMHLRHLDRVLFIGDNVKNDVLMPRSLGMQALHFNRSDILKRKNHPIPEGSFQAWEQFSKMMHSH